jgi:site-specific DNA-cytosine methylase
MPCAAPDTVGVWDVARVPEPVRWQRFAQILGEDLKGLPDFKADWMCSGLVAGGWGLQDMGVRHTGSGCDTDERVRQAAINLYGEECVARNFRFGHEGDLLRRTVWMRDGPWKSVQLSGSGPPCQPFALNGCRLGLRDPRAKVFLKVVDRMAEQANHGDLWGCFLENVRGILNRDGTGHRMLDVVLQRIARKLPNYHCEVKELNSKDWLPQHRARLYIVCVRKDLMERAGVTSLTLANPPADVRPPLADCLDLGLPHMPVGALSTRNSPHCF